MVSIVLGVLLQCGAAHEALSVEESFETRQEIYSPGLLIGTDRKSLIEFVIVSEKLEQLHRAKPKAVIELLLSIAEGANPTDSIKAIAFALALSDRIKGGGAICARHFKADAYDKLDEDWEETPRAHWIGYLRNVIKEQEKK